MHENPSLTLAHREENVYDVHDMLRLPSGILNHLAQSRYHKEEQLGIGNAALWKKNTRKENTHEPAQ